MAIWPATVPMAVKRSDSSVASRKVMAPPLLCPVQKPRPSS
jgi:hypothetical protein